MKTDAIKTTKRLQFERLSKEIHDRYFKSDGILFSDMIRFFEMDSGDVSPYREIRLEQLAERLSGLLADFVIQNLK